MKKIKVYIASKYSLGDKEENVFESFKVASELIDKGFVPYAPLYCHFIDMNYPKDYNVWFNLAIEWLEQCDCLLRILNGESQGADMEELYAENLNIPIFYSIEELEKYYQK